MGISMEHVLGRGRTGTDLRSVFAPPAVAGSEPGSILSTFRGVGRSGRGREGVLDLFERLRLISPEQRVGVAAAGADELGRAAAGVTLDASRAAAFGAAPTSRPLADAVAAAAASSSNPIYRGLYAQSLLRDAAQPALLDDVVHVAVDAVSDVADDAVRAVARPAVADDVLRGAMGFSAGVDDTVRLLARAARVLR